MIHAILVAYQNPGRTRTRWLRDLRPGLEKTGLPFCVTCVDNSQDRSDELAELFGAENYLWQEGKNLFYGGAINLAVREKKSLFTVYCCTQHGRALDATWVVDLLAPMQADAMVGQAGWLMGSNSPGGVAHDTKCEWVKERFHFNDGVHQHVQGGVFAARSDLLRLYPYPPEIPHLYTDHIFTWSIEKAGYTAANVPTVKSVWRDRILVTEGLKYTHDTSEG